LSIKKLEAAYILKLEKLTTKDALQLTNLLHIAYESDEKLGIHFAAATISQEEVKKHLLLTPTFGYKDQTGNLISTISVRLPWSENPSPYFLPHIGWVATNPVYKHQGYAKKIIVTTVTKFIKNVLKSPAATLGTAIEHPWLKELYKSLGFVPFEEVRKHSDHKTVYLVKILDRSNLENINDQELKTILYKAGVLKGENNAI
jgi:predicted GNAT family N-acyltransferase